MSSAVIQDNLNQDNSSIFECLPNRRFLPRINGWFAARDLETGLQLEGIDLSFQGMKCRGEKLPDVHLESRRMLKLVLAGDKEPLLIEAELANQDDEVIRFRFDTLSQLQRERLASWMAMRLTSPKNDDQ
ncbi:MAG: hypothetical protein CMH60_05625 [Myxococcales bacterium]|nr:hypothetical protein [Myxococcales bacterium]|tara:strand:+ start:126 stop:515 length:390 start_codon:yes stop_codon:yes gene_type:complete